LKPIFVSGHFKVLSICSTNWFFSNSLFMSDHLIPTWRCQQS
jgi:hypothetical protein